MIVLGIETSCDETAAAVVTDRGSPRILADRIRSQTDEHRPYGGIVPEIAARAHLEALDPLIVGALAESGIGFADLDGVAFTGGPRLIRRVILGTMAAKAVAPLPRPPPLAGNHLPGHPPTPPPTHRVALSLLFPL